MKQLPGTTHYYATPEGDIWSHFYGKLRKLNPKIDKGYAVVTLVEPARRNWGVHQLVAAAFLGERPEGFITCHKDGNRLNNRPENLYYGTYSDNNRDTVRHGNRNRATLNPQQVREIRLLLEEGDLTRQQIADEFGISLSTVKDIRARRTYDWVE